MVMIEVSTLNLDLQPACNEAIALARSLGCAVRFDFNRISVTVYPGSDAGEIVAKYDQDWARRAEAHKAPDDERAVVTTKATMLLRFAADRLVNVYGESPNTDYILAMRREAARLTRYDDAALSDAASRGLVMYKDMVLSGCRPASANPHLVQCTFRDFGDYFQTVHREELKIAVDETDPTPRTQPDRCNTS